MFAARSSHTRLWPAAARVVVAHRGSHIRGGGGE
jgi:hypothetical protein